MTNRPDPLGTPLTITPDLDLNPWADVRPEDLANTGELVLLERIGLLRNGTQEGRATVGLLFRLPDGRPVLAETTWRLLSGAVRALAAGPIASEEVLD